MTLKSDELLQRVAAGQKELVSCRDALRREVKEARGNRRYTNNAQPEPLIKIQHLMDDGNVDQVPTETLHHYVLLLEQFAELVDSVYEEVISSTFTATYQRRVIAQRDRRDRWWLWGQQSLRWVLGVTLAVGLYSFVLWLAGQDGWELVKIPARDVLMSWGKVSP